ncbi:carbamoyltransferase C-terminal domain-containing protein [Ferruginivarius sediminum]|uniref:Chitooligosaccharide deacetylase n=1 Tax=Ferruginivarius sediminum TaxID=2661937 RepID=A0A369TAD7_9PROT|nr:carbamoyltransferase C-terminal domain-containing protein [Ferruginivarius sediminum]RDD62291.1 hypothetical protein DRB17_08655 [Ferruginivarius sediminum]
MVSAPAGSRPQAAVHVDLDGASQIFRHNGWDYPYADDPVFETGVPALLQFLKHNNLHATLFTIAADLDDPVKRPLLEQAVAEGHEVASHTIRHSELNTLDPAAKRAEIVDSKRKLESELGVRVEGFRAPSYSIDRDSLELIAEAGYRYDSSTFPQRRFAERLQVPAIPPAPYRPLLDRPLVELPLPINRVTGLPFHPSYSLILGQGYFRRSLSAYARARLPVVLLFHLIDFAEPLPSDRLAGFKSRILTLSHRSAAAKRRQCRKVIEHVRESFDIVETSALLRNMNSEQQMSKVVLGISTTHETGAAVYEGHRCRAAVSEERMDRVKFSTKYPPKKSIKAAVAASGVDPRDITDVVVAGLPAGRLFRRLAAGQLQDTFDFHGWNDYFPHFNKVLYRGFAFSRALGYRRVLDFLRQEYGIRPNLHFVDHHRCHAAAAHRTAPFADSLIVTADGVGDGLSITISEGRQGRINLLHEVPYPHSFGQFYTACTQILGFRANRHEGKITGLSGYGEVNPELYAKVKSTIRRSGPDFRLDKRYYSEGIVRGFSLAKLRKGEDLFDTLQYRDYKPPLKKLVEGYSREDVAAVFQKLLEEEVIEVVRPFAERTGMKNLSLCGGLFANVKLNAVLFRALNFDNVYVYPHMGDGGLCAGAALEFLQAEPEPFDDVYFGPGYSEDEMAEALREAAGDDLQFERHDDVEDTIAGLLADGNVVARFDGRMEFGPRALCNRSILYSAGDPKANDWLNKRLGRTEFMPFAPVAMAERAGSMFMDIEGTEHACKFMTIILDCTEWTKKNCPAVVHVDGTARPQLVTPAINPSMHRILECYEKRTGIPLLVNTSFNMHEEPIVCSPRDAVRAFLASRLDYLAMGPFVARIGEAAARKDSRQDSVLVASG